MITLSRSKTRIQANPEKVLARYFKYGGEERIRRIVSAVSSMENRAVEEILHSVLEEFEHRHKGFKKILLENFGNIEAYTKDLSTLTPSRKLLLGSYFTHEYSVEAAALFNPSIVKHPDQSGLNTGELRFIMSLRATGEGHISSIEFTSGVVSGEGEITLDPSPGKLVGARTHEYDGQGSDYSITFEKGTLLGNRVIFPVSPDESNGMEDVRFVEFSDRDRSTYVGTYTAYDGRHIRSKIIETEDFTTFHIRALTGKAIAGKGMALFPETIEGRYAIIGRQDGENISIMFSEDLYSWEQYKAIQFPERDWELLQLGNCGSPVKTNAGWLLLTHAVGPMRKYVISASLLDLYNPEVVLSTLDIPLLEADATEREGYVPNVVYTCGVLKHLGNLIIPYAMSDSAIGFARVDLQEVIDELVKK
jgi:predicted GH43/DUF377 family glycosyl hydrolase